MYTFSSHSMMLFTLAGRELDSLTGIDSLTGKCSLSELSSSQEGSRRLAKARKAQSVAAALLRQRQKPQGRRAAAAASARALPAMWVSALSAACQGEWRGARGEAPRRRNRNSGSVEPQAHTSLPLQVFPECARLISLLLAV